MVMDNHNILNLLISKVIEHAEKLLNEFGEFYPFSFVEEVDDSLRLFNIYSGGDYPDSTQHLEDLTNVLNDKYETYVMAINSMLNNESGSSESIILLKICDADEFYEDSYFVYHMDYNKVVVGDLSVFPN